MARNGTSPPPGRLLSGGAPEGFDAKLLAQAAQTQGGPCLHVARDDRRMAAMRAGLAFFAPDLAIIDLPAWDCLPYDRVSPNPDIAARRMAALATLAAGVEGPMVVITTLNAALQRLPTPDYMRESSFSAVVDTRVDLDALTAYFVRNGYARVSTVAEPGDHAVRGGVIDVFPPGFEQPVRLDFFGDVLDSARLFVPDTQRSDARIPRVDLAPISEAPLTEAAIARFRSAYREAFGAGADDPLYEAVSNGRRWQGMEHWLPFFHETLTTVFDYLPDAPVTLDHQIEESRAARWETIRDHYENRRAAMMDKKGVIAGSAPYKPAPPKAMFLDDAAWAGALADRPARFFSPFPTASGPGVVDMGGKPGRSFAPERQQESLNLFAALADHIRAKRSEKKTVLLACYSEGAADRMRTLLQDHEIEDALLAEDWRSVQPQTISLVVWALESGFETADLCVTAEQDILGERLIRAPRKRKRADNFLTEAASISPGDLVVHVEHGVGRYSGLQTVEALGAPHDCLALEYAGGDKLYVPVENIELLSRYGSEQASLDKLGGGAWQARKAKLKKRILEIADQLIRVAAERKLRQAPIYAASPGLYEEFSARFPYEETDDQLSAIEAVLEDLASGQPMDRLVCGDVGFGKTEVALRAAFVAALEGAQVAVIAPTTLLARQHARSFEERFKGLPVRVGQLSRFVSTKDAAYVKRGLADGQVDIVVGTHALLAKGVTFANLGLLVIDEEQHFGVKHKERLKALRSDVHVLTMTATPIPRTLQMSMTGVRELSLIATPPVDRLAVRTYVAPWDAITVREALLREHFRGGQSFYVVPRVSDIAEQEEFIREHVPEVKLAVAHGQMAAGALDQVMNAFYDGKFDVLLATTIIESGLDIPTANTLIVHRADMFGLAQLYQIRGRVGRSKTRAYAYFTTRPGKRLTPAAEKRLKVLGSLDSLGAGFTLASHDLDIRGAGNLLGEAQSGHIREVGFELYQDMLEEAMAKMRAGEMAEAEVDDQWSPQISLGVPVLIPDDYVTDLDVRLGLYRRLSSLAERRDLEGFAAELHDRFGKPPRAVETLLRVVQIKTLCRKAQVAKLDTGPKGAVITFRNDKHPNPIALVDWINGQHGRAKLRPDNKLFVRRDWTEDAVRVKGAYAVARDLAKTADG